MIYHLTTLLFSTPEKKTRLKKIVIDFQMSILSILGNRFIPHKKTLLLSHINICWSPRLQTSEVAKQDTFLLKLNIKTSVSFLNEVIYNTANAYWIPYFSYIITDHLDIYWIGFIEKLWPFSQWLLEVKIYHFGSYHCDKIPSYFLYGFRR